MRCCAVTVSCLPRFAQPYRVVCNATIEAFFEGRPDRSDVRGLGELLGRYRRAYQQWFGTLRMECGALFGRSPPEEKPLIFLGPDHGDLWRPSLRQRQTVGQLRMGAATRRVRSKADSAAAWSSFATSAPAVCCMVQTVWAKVISAAALPRSCPSAF
jgi:hypothetical protein